MFNNYQLYETNIFHGFELLDVESSSSMYGNTQRKNYEVHSYEVSGKVFTMTPTIH